MDSSIIAAIGGTGAALLTAAAGLVWAWRRSPTSADIASTLPASSALLGRSPASTLLGLGTAEAPERAPRAALIPDPLPTLEDHGRRLVALEADRTERDARRAERAARAEEEMETRVRRGVVSELARLLGELPGAPHSTRALDDRQGKPDAGEHARRERIAREPRAQRPPLPPTLPRDDRDSEE